MSSINEDYFSNSTKSNPSYEEFLVSAAKWRKTYKSIEYEIVNHGRSPTERHWNYYII